MSLTLQRRLLRARDYYSLKIILSGLAGALILTGCEEPPSPGSAPKASTPSAAFYREISGDELIERWGAYAASRVAGGSGSSARVERNQLAAATSGFESFRDLYAFEDVYQYGSCVVFNLTSQGWDWGYPLIDCVGAPSEGNDVNGHFHAAHVCEFGYGMHAYVVRAGEITPETRVIHADPDEHPRYHHHEVDVTLHDPSSGKSSTVAAQWLEKFYYYAGSEEYYNPDEVEYEEFDLHLAGMVSTDLSDTGFLGFVPVDSDVKVQWTIDTSAAELTFEANDAAAYTEYHDRCATARRLEEERSEQEGRELDREIREEVERFEAEGLACAISVWSSGHANGYFCGTHREVLKRGIQNVIVGQSVEIRLTSFFDGTYQSPYKPPPGDITPPFLTNASYTAVSSDESVAEASVSGAVLIVILRGAGTATVEVTATGDEGEVSLTFRATVSEPAGHEP